MEGGLEGAFAGAIQTRLVEKVVSVRIEHAVAEDGGRARDARLRNSHQLQAKAGPRVSAGLELVVVRQVAVVGVCQR